MLKRLIIIISIFFFLSLSRSILAGGIKPGEFLVLCYHSVPVKASPDYLYSISRKRFVEQIEYLRTHGYQPVSFDDILMAHEGKKKLPEKPVLLTFDDAYISYYKFVVPFLEKLNYPSVLAVVAKFIDQPPDGLPEPVMNWEQIKELSSHKLVEIASHTFDLHKGIQYNPQGNVGPAVNILAFNSKTNTYEKEEEYKARIEADFLKQKKVFRERLGFVPRIVVWPYGKYTSISMDIAKRYGFKYTFTLEEGFSHINSLGEIKRNLIKNAPIKNFIKMVANPSVDKPTIRAVQVDLDLIYANSYEQMDKNLGKLIDRLVELKINTVFLQAFADPEGTGNIKSVYFPNRILPIRADIFSHAVHQLIIRDISVYAWMPTLSIELRDSELNKGLKVLEIVDGRPAISTSWYRRLTPFSDVVVALIKGMYEDMASHAQIQGVLFQDDAYLTDTEDFHPLAIKKYKDKFGVDMVSENLDPNLELVQEWARFKTERLIEFTNLLKQSVRKYRPNTLFARNLYAEVLDNPKAELWFAQDYERFLKNYDQVVVMSYPQMERIKRPSEWLDNLVNRVKGFHDGIEKTVFKLQAYDWRKEEWISDQTLLEELRDVLSSGGRHIAYYPDNFWIDKPLLSTMKLEMSTQVYPFIR